MTGRLRPLLEPDAQTASLAALTRYGVWNIYVMHASGTGAPVKIGPDAAMHPMWSPGVRRMALVSASDIWVMYADGSGAINITNPPGASEASPHRGPQSVGSLKVAVTSAGSPHRVPTDVYDSRLDLAGAELDRRRLSDD